MATIVEKGLHNIAFTAFLQLGDVKPCIDLLIKTDRIPEAAFLARTYAPSQASDVVKRWKAHLTTGGKGKIARTIADPEVSADLFEEDWEEALRLETQAPLVDEEEVQQENEEEEEEVMVDAPEPDEDEPEQAGETEQAFNPIDQVEKLVDGVKELVVGSPKHEEAEEAEKESA